MTEGSRLAGSVLTMAFVLVGFAVPRPAGATAPTAAEAFTSLHASATAAATLTPEALRPDTVIAVKSAAGPNATAAAARAMALSASLRAEGDNWIGIPYRWGGTTRRGIDCSAFVQQYVRASLDIDLPRTTATQVHEGRRISRGELMPGDLVFFRRRGVRHVGVYLGENEFIHASSSRGVTVSSMDSGYWSRHYWTSRRILPEITSRTRPTPRAEARRAVVDSIRSVRQ